MSITLHLDPKLGTVRPGTRGVRTLQVLWPPQRPSTQLPHLNSIPRPDQKSRGRDVMIKGKGVTGVTTGTIDHLRKRVFLLRNTVLEYPPTPGPHRTASRPKRGVEPPRPLPPTSSRTGERAPSTMTISRIVSCTGIVPVIITRISKIVK